MNYVPMDDDEGFLGPLVALRLGALDVQDMRAGKNEEGESLSTSPL